MTEKDCKMSAPSNTLVFVVFCLLLFMIGVAAIHDWLKARKERLEYRLSDDLWRFPTSYRALLKECGAVITDSIVQKYLLAIRTGFDDSRNFLRLGMVHRASKRFAYVLWCCRKAQERAQAAAFNAETESLLLDDADVDLDEVANSNALLARRRAARQ